MVGCVVECVVVCLSHGAVRPRHGPHPLPPTPRTSGAAAKKQEAGHYHHTESVTPVSVYGGAIISNALVAGGDYVRGPRSRISGGLPPSSNGPIAKLPKLRT